MNVKLTLKYPSGYSTILTGEFLDGTTKEQIAEKFADDLTNDYKKYIGGSANLRKYKFGQYKLILHLLEGKL